MKLWLISQSVNNDYESFECAVVAAKTKEDARFTHPSSWAQAHWSVENSRWEYDINDYINIHYYSDDWTHPDNVSVKYLGESELPAGVICSSNRGSQIKKRNIE